MDKAKFEPIARLHVERMKSFLGLTDWVVEINLQRIVGDWWALCDTSNLDYRKAIITFDYHCYDDDLTIVNDVYHEMCHVLHADFTNYRLTCEALCQPTTDQVVKVEQRAWSHAAEGFVLRMEWIWRDRLRGQYLDELTRPEPAR